MIPFLPSDLQPWARHLQKGTLKQAISNILDVKGMANELENRKNAFLKLFDYQLRPDSYNATTKELVIAGMLISSRNIYQGIKYVLDVKSSDIADVANHIHDQMRRGSSPLSDISK